MDSLKADSEMGKTFTAKVRILEAICGIDFPTPDEHRFRVAMMKSIGKDLQLPEVRNLTIAGDAPGVVRPSVATTGKK
jgi:hypothetical protein